MGYSINTLDYKNKLESFTRCHGISLNLDDPVTIQDKLAWLNLYEPDMLKTKCADKYLLHEYCNDVLSEDICIPIIAVYDRVEDIKWNELPEQFVVKCNHGSGMNIIVKNKSTFDINKAKFMLGSWMCIDFAFQNGFEAHYHDIPHKIVVEKYMNDGHDTLYDYKFWCFNGEPKIYTINDGNGHGKWMKFYDMDKNSLPYKRTDFMGEPSTAINHPENFDLMKEYATKLSSNFKFVRVDFYEINHKVYLGELTFTPGAFIFKFVNRNDDIEIGKMLSL
jgi:hypothetical protein